MLAGLAAGCGSAEDPVAETPTEAEADAAAEAADAATEDGGDGGVEVADEDGSGSTQTDEGSPDDEGGSGSTPPDEGTPDEAAVTLPDTWPGAIPLVAEHHIISVDHGEGGEDHHTSATLGVPQSFTESVAVMESAMAGAGWATDGAATRPDSGAGESWQQSYTAESVRLTVTIRAADDGATVTYDVWHDG